MNEKIHHGRNIKRFREMMGIKQEALAQELGEDWSQKKISLLEQKEEVEEELLRQVGEILRIPVEAFKNFDEEQAINIISNTFDHCNQPASVFYNSSINPLDQIIRFHEEKIALYERMLKEKDEMMERLERLIKEK
ncbi:XRE family transcriptional regulator [Algoriphagus lacus]|uniref:XRE family transcriptional regulator n=1 Tax=Algoriphagus lacus TaxID=2056311 RepID=A0A418PM22_9BACT|nr:helix-turn-helix domain-containing protein [Algoriphagus lacus]RIW12514.1 XRE family transcriptional regulator [Algoriphagus lacus]